MVSFLQEVLRKFLPLPQVPLGCLPWGSFVMQLLQKLLACIQDNLQGL